MNDSSNCVTFQSDQTNNLQSDWCLVAELLLTESKTIKAFFFIKIKLKRILVKTTLQKMLG